MFPKKKRTKPIMYINLSDSSIFETLVYEKIG